MDDAQNRKAIGLRIREIRKHLGLNQIDVADAVNMNRATYSQYETGYIDLPVSRLVLICDVLRTTPNAVLGYGKAGDTELAMTRARDVVAQLADLLGMTVVDAAGTAASDQQELVP